MAESIFGLTERISIGGLGTGDEVVNNFSVQGGLRSHNIFVVEEREDSF